MTLYRSCPAVSLFNGGKVSEGLGIQNMYNHHISNLTVVWSSTVTVCVRNAAIGGAMVVVRVGEVFEIEL